MAKLISIIIPVYNEAQNVPIIYREIKYIFKGSKYRCEIIFVNDGSRDNTQAEIDVLVAKDKAVKFIDFSRNFGKEMATSAGIHSAKGAAAIMIDADLQHPVELIPEFLQKWEAGAETVIGIRKKNNGEGFIKKIGSIVFNKFMNLIGETKMIRNSTDFRLIDRKIINEFNKFSEHNRITRGLLDWLGFKTDFIYFEANERTNGEASYNFVKLFKLSTSTFVTHSLFPLRFAGYLGIAIILTSGPLGVFVFLNKYVLSDPLGFHFSGTAILALIILFLVGIILACLGLIALYIGNIQSEVMGRPMYVVRNNNFK